MTDMNLIKLTQYVTGADIYVNANAIKTIEHVEKQYHERSDIPSGYTRIHMGDGTWKLAIREDVHEVTSMLMDRSGNDATN